MGRVAGAPVIVSPGWLVAAAVLTFLFAPTVRAAVPNLSEGAAYAVAALGAGLLFVSVFLHEVAHALVARGRGVVVHELAVTLLGGHTRMGAAAPSPTASAVIAAAGPAANLALAAAGWFVAPMLPAAGIAALLATSVALTNGFVGIFNLLPGLPLDGGRVLEALVWRLTGDRTKGTVVAAWVGRLLAVAVVGWLVLVPLAAGRSPDLTMIVWGAIIGAVLWSGAAQSLQGARAEQAVHRLSVRALMSPARGVPVTATLGQVDMHDATTPEVVLVEDDGRAVAYVDRSALAAVPPTAHALTPLHAVAVALPKGSTIDVGLTGSEAVRAVGAAARHSPVIAVVDGSRGVVGLLRAQDVISALRSGA